MLPPDRSDMRLYYAQHGSGIPVVLLHDSASTGGQWRGLIKALGEGFATWTPDLAGYGRSQAPRVMRRWNLWDEARFLAPLFGRTRERVHLIGHSFGGAVALAAACRWPEQVRSIVLFEPALFSLLRTGTPEDRELLREVTRLARLIRNLTHRGLPDLAMRHFVDYWSGNGAWERLSAGDRWALSRMAGKVVEDFQSLLATSLETAQLSRVQCPVCVMSGSRSPAVTGRIADLLTSCMPGARRVTMERLGHMAPVISPEVTAEHLRGALMRESVRGRGDDAAALRECLLPVAAPDLAASAVAATRPLEAALPG